MYWLHCIKQVFDCSEIISWYKKLYHLNIKFIEVFRTASEGSCLRPAAAGQVLRQQKKTDPEELMPNIVRPPRLRIWIPYLQSNHTGTHAILSPLYAISSDIIWRIYHFHIIHNAITNNAVFHFHIHSEARV